MDARAKLLGHPIQQMLIVFPLGLLAMAVVFDLALALSFGGGCLALFTGWLGGELVDRHAVGVHEGAHLEAPSSLSVRRVRS